MSCMSEDEMAELDSLLARLSDCDLGEWDRDFVDDHIKRLDKFGVVMVVTPRQRAQLDRMKEKYLS